MVEKWFALNNLAFFFFWFFSNKLAFSFLNKFNIKIIKNYIFLINTMQINYGEVTVSNNCPIIILLIPKIYSIYPSITKDNC